MSDIDNIISYLRTMTHIPYMWWDGDSWMADNTPPFWISATLTSSCSAPTADYIRSKGGINCAGLMNLGLQYVGLTPPGINTDYPGGTWAWGAFMIWEKYDHKHLYPRGSIVLRKYRNETDQGHLAMITTDDENDLIHSSAVDGMVVEVPIKIVNLFAGTDYFEYVSTPDMWLIHS